MSSKLSVILVFLGSVFITSGSFVETTNTPKLYFVFATLLVVFIINVLQKKQIVLDVFLSKAIFWGTSMTCIFQACYGLYQYIGWLPSNHSKFAITGSFDNPTGFAAILAMGFPIGLFLCAKSGNVKRFLAIAGLSVISIAVFLSGSRTGVLAVFISSVIVLLHKPKIIRKFQQLRYFRLLSGLILGLLISFASILYHQKKDSANGRLLIWKVSLEMIKDKPLLGHGNGAFQAKYMDYQAEYFKNNPNSKFKLLADNVKHPFNEFIKVAVEFGWVGLMVVISLLLLIFWKIIKSESGNKKLVLSV